MKLFFFILGLSIGSGCFAQWPNQSHVALIGGKRNLEPYQQGLKPHLSLDGRRTLLQKNWVGVMGLKFGAQYQKVHKFGIGAYFLTNRVFDDGQRYDLPNTKVEYEFRYFSLFYQRSLFFSRRWDAGVNAHLGGGRIRVFYPNPENRNDRLELDPRECSVLEFATFGKYNLFYWLGIGAGFGYRFVFATNSYLQQKFSNPIFVVNVQINLVRLGRSFFDESAKNEY